MPTWRAKIHRLFVPYRPIVIPVSWFAGLSSVTKGLITTGVTAMVAVLALAANVSTEGWLALLLTWNGLELGFILRNTADISELTGRVEAEH